MQKLKNSFWFTHSRLNLNAQVYYGNAANLPDTLGKFDVVLLGAILLHNRDPLTIIENCARLSKGVIIIVEPILIVNNPASYSLPRRIRLGVMLNF